MAWLAPRGIVAAATASAFGPTLAQAGVKGAGKILPIAFIVIFGTVAIYGLTAGDVHAEPRLPELEEITDALLVTSSPKLRSSDNFNALAAYELRQELGNDHVYRLAPGSDLLDLVPCYAEGRILFGRDLTYDELTRRFEEGPRS